VTLPRRGCRTDRKDRQRISCCGLIADRLRVRLCSCAALISLMKSTTAEAIDEFPFKPDCNSNTPFTRYMQPVVQPVVSCTRDCTTLQWRQLIRAKRRVSNCLLYNLNLEINSLRQNDTVSYSIRNHDTTFPFSTPNFTFIGATRQQTENSTLGNSTQFSARARSSTQDSLRRNHGVAAECCEELRIRTCPHACPHCSTSHSV